MGALKNENTKMCTSPLTARSSSNSRTRRAGVSINTTQVNPLTRITSALANLAVAFGLVKFAVHFHDEPVINQNVGNAFEGGWPKINVFRLPVVQDWRCFFADRCDSVRVFPFGAAFPCLPESRPLPKAQGAEALGAHSTHCITSVKRST